MPDVVVNISVKIDGEECVPQPRPKLQLHAFGPVLKQKLNLGLSEGTPMLGILQNDQQAVVTYGGPVDKNGQPAPVEKLVFQSTNEKVATFVAGVIDPTTLQVVPDTANDGFIRGVVIAQSNGVAQVRISADPDLSDVVAEIDGEFVDIQVTGGQAVGFGAPVFGTPVNKPA
jgi:hypothetical protein